MFDSIILLTEPPEQMALAAVLRARNPVLTIHPVATPDQFAEFDQATLAQSRLLAFATTVIVPPQVLSGLGFGAYNFHPGPPRYPGWAPAHFALYEQASEFGVTVHEMAQRVDSGPILNVVRFPIPPGVDVLGLEELAYAHLARLFWKLAERMACDPAPPPASELRWNGTKYSRRTYRAMCDIPLDITKEDLERRLRVFGGNHFGMAPTIRLHGVEFRAVV
ncbi:formyltransferase family protein [Bradyrhizobium sp. STM 3562]|uniref:formyltransferase family protein n=1 Tax=Bradyrhizobium sp. STM 3562 TaxID=578924 RepID=UPI00388E2F5B